MLRKLMFVGFLALAFGFAAVNAQVITPTSDSNQQLDINVGSGGDTAQVTQQVNVNVPPATALHSTAGSLTFDISQIGNQDGTWYCVQGAASPTYGTFDPATGDYVMTGLGSDYYNQSQVLPMGTYYSIATWPAVAIHGAQQITQYPPATLADGVVTNASKAYFVCYRTFLMQTFSNFSSYDLQVTRDGTTDVQAYPEPIYIQGNTYCSANSSDDATGFFALTADGGPAAHLIPVRWGSGPTGAVAEQCNQPGTKSWLDNLIVVAVKIDGEHFGNSSTTLTYTMVSADAAFTAPQ